VVEYQQTLQTVSDPLLGWTTVDDVQYYVRQFRDMKGAIDIDAIDADALADYAGICGHLLAKGHAGTSGASMIAGYLGGGHNAEKAFCRFARAYADQTERDHAELVQAVRRGVLPAEPALTASDAGGQPARASAAGSPTAPARRAGRRARRRSRRRRGRRRRPPAPGPASSSGSPRRCRAPTTARR
jgi:hypothetical protein